MIIAVDFDGTLCKECYPYIGEANRELIDALVVRKKEETSSFYGHVAKSLFWKRQ